MSLRVFALLFVLGTVLPRLQAGEASNAVSMQPALDPPSAASETKSTTQLRDSRWTAIWAASVAFEGSGSAFDAYTSYHRGPYESNALLRDSDGQFGNKAVAIKAGLFTGITAGQWLVIHKWPKTAKLFSPINAALGILYLRDGFHNQAFLSTH